MFDFIKQLALMPKETGAVSPSSKSLSEFIVKQANVTKAKAIVELGPGTGVFTAKIMKNKAKDAKFFALEINPFFVSKTKKICPAATVYRAPAEDISVYLKKHGLKKCDCIVSGLPWANFNITKQNKIISEAVRVLEDDGTFATFAYLHGAFLPSGQRFARMLSNSFSSVKRTKTVWKNLPPCVCLRL